MRSSSRWLMAAGVLALMLGYSAWQERGNASIALAHAVAQEYDLDYAIADGPLLTNPSPFLVAMLRRARSVTGAARTALDIGSGSGRNTLYLARRGYRVTAVDLSQVGLDLTAQQARAGRLAVHTVRQNINNFN